MPPAVRAVSILLKMFSVLMATFLVLPWLILSAKEPIGGAPGVKPDLAGAVFREWPPMG